MQEVGQGVEWTLSSLEWMSASPIFFYLMLKLNPPLGCWGNYYSKEWAVLSPCYHHNSLQLFFSKVIKFLASALQVPSVWQLKPTKQKKSPRQCSVLLLLLCAIIFSYDYILTLYLSRSLLRSKNGRKVVMNKRNKNLLPLSLWTRTQFTQG